MSAKTDMPALIDQLGAAALECRQLLADVRTVTKDLRAAVKEAQREREQLADAVDKAVGADIDEAVKVQLAALGELTRKAMDESVAKVSREFERLTNIMMTGDNRGRATDGFDLRRMIEGGQL